MIRSLNALADDPAANLNQHIAVLRPVIVKGGREFGQTRIQQADWPWPPHHRSDKNMKAHSQRIRHTSFTTTEADRRTIQQHQKMLDPSLLNALP